MKEHFKRCEWVHNTFDDYVKYHDTEWGVPVYDDRTLFEFLTLEGAQAGLSWSTILKKRANYITAFSSFDIEVVSKYDETTIKKLLLDPGIVRNALKVRSTVSNAQRLIEIAERHDSFSQYLWNFTDGKPIINRWQKMTDVPAQTTLSDKISKDLKKRGFKFVGSTIIYAYMQAIGMVNDHTVDCFRHAELS